jgi:hypothetical protein
MSTTQIVSQMFRLEKIKQSAWDGLANSHVASVDGIIQCGFICLNNRDECDIFNYDEETKTCSYGKVKLNTIYILRLL